MGWITTGASGRYLMSCQPFERLNFFGSLRPHLADFCLMRKVVHGHMELTVIYAKQIQCNITLPTPHRAPSHSPTNARKERPYPPLRLTGSLI
ncbi:protein of unknown function [Georgfuchsia toluolica]|uniref:Uncharacterized protein n=1 Tax=Georgfuchsia toluolica TaxID=424218 RepID=A0A916J290_9PROT|nr:protein of unknown function [Georgfuchsia toluolica]